MLADQKRLFLIRLYERRKDIDVVAGGLDDHDTQRRYLQVGIAD